MGKLILKPDLIREAQETFASLEALIAQVSAAQLECSSVNGANWSLKDVLAHVADWSRRCAEWCDAGLKGEAPQLPAPGYTWKETPRLNAAIHKAHQHTSYAEVLLHLREGHATLMRIAAELTDAQLTTLNHFAWTGPSWTVANYIRANTASHYRWASKYFRTWIKRNKPEVKTRKPLTTMRTKDANGNTPRR